MKAIIEAIGDETITVGGQVYYVTDQVRKYLPNFAIGQEVDINFKEIDGVSMISFCKAAGVPVGNQQQYKAPQSYSTQPAQQFTTPRPAGIPPGIKAPMLPQQTQTGGLKGDIDKLTAAIITAYGLDVNTVKQIATLLKQF